jgi:hypothetical protein
MKSITDIVGVILIILGIGVLSYQGFSYTKREDVVKLGDLKITAQTQEHVYIPPIAGGLALVAGVVLVAIGRFGKK